MCNGVPIVNMMCTPNVQNEIENIVQWAYVINMIIIVNIKTDLSHDWTLWCNHTCYQIYVYSALTYVIVSQWKEKHVTFFSIIEFLLTV